MRFGGNSFCYILENQLISLKFIAVEILFMFCLEGLGAAPSRLAYATVPMTAPSVHQGYCWL